MHGNHVTKYIFYTNLMYFMGRNSNFYLLSIILHIHLQDIKSKYDSRKITSSPFNRLRVSPAGDNKYLKITYLYLYVFAGPV